MKSIAFFNNKGGVGKSTLAYHTGYALSELGYRVLLLDLDPQSNLTLFGIQPDELDKIWTVEEPFIDDFEKASKSSKSLKNLISGSRSIHFLLKPTEDGVSDFDQICKVRPLAKGLDLIPGRLSLHMYEDKLSSRWSDAYRGDPLAIRTIAKIRKICEEYGEKNGYDYVLLDTSPSLGILNKVIISTADGIVVPCGPDLFSLYGIRNIGRALGQWKSEFETLEMLLSSEKRSSFPKQFVRFLGFTIYNAKKYSAGKNPYNLAQADYHFASKFPETVRASLPEKVWGHLSQEVVSEPIGKSHVMHTHNTLPRLAQKYQTPMWLVPSIEKLDPADISTVRGNRALFEKTKIGYHEFSNALISRL